MISGLVAMLSVVMSAIVGCGVARFFVDHKSARIAGFAFSIGSLSGVIGLNDQGLGLLSLAIGAIIGLVLVWYLFFKENRATSDAGAEPNILD